MRIMTPRETMRMIVSGCISLVPSLWGKGVVVLKGTRVWSDLCRDVEWDIPDLEWDIPDLEWDLVDVDGELSVVEWELFVAEWVLSDNDSATARSRLGNECEMMRSSILVLGPSPRLFSRVRMLWKNSHCQSGRQIDKLSGKLASMMWCSSSASFAFDIAFSISSLFISE